MLVATHQPLPTEAVVQLTPRLARPTIAVALAAGALAVTTAPADAKDMVKCAASWQEFRSSMASARSWIGIADWLAGMGAESAAQQASDEAERHMNDASGALGRVGVHCS
jgi:hypothetical protein